MAATMIEQRELDDFLLATAEVLREATVRTPAGLALLASPPDGKHPFIHTRVVAVAIQTFGEVGALETARELATFLINVQAPSGAWVQRYDLEGREAEQSRQEDATALAILGLLSYVAASGDQEFAARARDAIEAATGYTLARTLNPYLYLIETSNGLDNGPAGAGYELWNQCAHAQAFALAHRVYGGERYRRLALLIRRSIGLLMTQEVRFLRRLDPQGYPDPRPDVTLLAPYYFGLWAPTERTVVNSAELIERTLWNVEIGGYIRHLPYSPVERQELPGTWPQFSAWMAQFHYEIGNKDRAEAVLRWILDQAVDGRLPEVVAPGSSVRRFGEEQRQALQRLTLGPGVPARNGLSLEQARERLLRDLASCERQADERDLARSGLPHVWAHLETLRALKRGGLVEQLRLDGTGLKGEGKPRGTTSAADDA